MTIRVVNHARRPAEIRSYTPARYVDPAYLELEWQRVWRTTWLLAGLEQDLREPGDFFVFDLGREQILVTRTSAGSTQGFYNVCQHRGNRLVTAERGHAENFRCAYHAWTYANDGALKGVPHRDRFPNDVPCAERSLRRVRTATWQGLVFVCLANDPPPLHEFLGPVVEHLAPYRFDQMIVVEDQTARVACNWKAVVDNFGELYHVDFLHPQHKRMVDCSNDTVHLFDNGHTGLAVPGATVNPRFPVPEAPTDIQSAQLESLGLNPADFTGRVLDVRRAVQERKRAIGRELGFDYSAFSDEQLSDVWQYNLFPNAILSFTPEHLWILRPRPHPSDPARCEFDKISLLRFADPAINAEARDIAGPGRQAATASGLLPEDYRRPERDVFDHDDIVAGRKTMTITIDQDIELLGGVQAGMTSRGFDSVWLSEDELRVAHFHNELDALIGG